MKVIKDPYGKNHIVSRTTALTPYQVYLEQVRSVSDNMRYADTDVEYYPMQFGGLKGQRQAITGVAVVDILNFKSNGNTDT